VLVIYQCPLQIVVQSIHRKDAKGARQSIKNTKNILLPESHAVPVFAVAGPSLAPPRDLQGDAAGSEKILSWRTLRLCGVFYPGCG
jgi:hypothetical protein